MARTGIANLPLHGGKAPPWLFGRMVRLSREIAGHVVAEHGADEMLRRLSDPFWFQAFGCVLGFDWHSSGVTTTVCGALKEGIRGSEADFGFYVAGGKGATSRKTPGEIAAACETLSLEPKPLVYASRMAAKVDSAAVQDGYQLYHHSFLFTPAGRWAVIQQGMSDATGMARRYHWSSHGFAGDFVDEPHAAVCCDERSPTLNLVASESAPARSASAEIATQDPTATLRTLSKLPTLDLASRHHLVAAEDVATPYMKKILLRTWERAPKDFESLLGIEGVGAKTLRALALVSELVYGTTASTKDPARFSFAHGGKDGHPFPVDRETYDRTIDVLSSAVSHAKVDRSEKVSALRRLAAFANPPPERLVHDA
ncbi:MAG: DUF763 domain-containing protein [Thermoanaerobaculia bacterium]